MGKYLWGLVLVLSASMQARSFNTCRGPENHCEVIAQCEIDRLSPHQVDGRRTWIRKCVSPQDDMPSGNAYPSAINHESGATSAPTNPKAGCDPGWQLVAVCVIE